MSDNRIDLMVERSTDLLYPPFATMVIRLTIELQKAGVRLFPFETYRSPQRQDELYAKGRTEDGNIVTNAKRWKSWHQYGLAADFAFKDENGRWGWEGDYSDFAPLAAQLGLRMIGPKDPLHVEFPITQTLSEAQSVSTNTSILSFWQRIKRIL